MKNDELVVYAPTAILGYGFSDASMERALRQRPDFVAVDGGSSDPGPYYLGSDASFLNPVSLQHDASRVVAAVAQLGVPFLMGTAGGSGGRAHVDSTVELFRPSLAAHGLQDVTCTIDATTDLSWLKEAANAGITHPLGRVPELSDEQIDRACKVVTLMGPEPYIDALDAGYRVIIGGRSDDAAVFAAPALRAGFDPGLSWLMGKLLECGSAVAEPRFIHGHDGILARLRSDHLVLEPLQPDVRCTVQSVAAMLLHENESAVRHEEPTGFLDLTNLRVEQIDERRVKLSGAVFETKATPTLRVEGVQRVGYRALVVGWTRDPVLISTIDSYLASVEDRVRRRVVESGIALADEFQLVFRVIGRNAVMGEREREHVPEDAHELGILIETLGRNQEQALNVAAAARTAVKNAHYIGKLCDEGCVTFPYSPSDVALGACYEYSIWHAAQCADPSHLRFPVNPIQESTVPEVGSHA